MHAATTTSAPILAAAPEYLPQNIAFGILAAIMIYAAIRVVTTKNVVHAALWLVLVLAGVAGNFILLGNEFLAVTQVLVYIGAIVVLFLFGVMLTRAPIGADAHLDNDQRGVAIAVAVPLLALMGYVLWDSFRDQRLTDKGDLVVQSTQQVSDSIFGNFLIPFEAVSILLLASLIGAIVLARRD